MKRLILLLLTLLLVGNIGLEAMAHAPLRASEQMEIPVTGRDGAEKVPDLYDGEVEMRTVYCRPHENWTMCYAYWGGSIMECPVFPGVVMTLQSDGLWCLEIPADALHVTFSDGAVDSGRAELGQSNLYDVQTGSWSVYQPPVTYATLQCRPAAHWAGCYVYWQGGTVSSPGWPGTKMLDSGNGIYTCKVPSDAELVVFNDGTDHNKTPQLTLPKDQRTLFLVEDWCWVLPACITGPYYTMGSAGVCGSEFIPNDSQNIMVGNGKGVWTRTYRYVQPGTYFLAVTDGSFRNNWTDTVPGMDLLSYQLTVTNVSHVRVIFDAVKETAAFALIPVSFTEAANDNTLYCKTPEDWTACYVYWSGGANPAPKWPGRSMTMNEDGIWQCDVPADATSVLFHNNGLLQNIEQPRPFLDDPSKMYVFDFDYWTAYEGMGSDPGVTPQEKFYVAGVRSLCGSEWNPCDPANRMTDNGDGTWSITYRNVIPGYYEFKITNGTWDVSFGGGTEQESYIFTVGVTTDVTIVFHRYTGTISLSLGGGNVPDGGGDKDPTEPPSVTESTGSTVNPPTGSTGSDMDAPIEGTVGGGETPTDPDFETEAKPTQPTGGNSSKPTQPTGGNNSKPTQPTSGNSSKPTQPTTPGNTGRPGEKDDPTNNYGGTTQSGGNTGSSGNANQNGTATANKFRVVGNAPWMGDWDPASDAGLMKEVSKGVYQKTFENVPPGDYEMKITQNGIWDKSWGNGDGNYCFTITKSSTILVTFTYSGENSRIEVRGKGIGSMDTGHEEDTPEGDVYRVTGNANWLGNWDPDHDDTVLHRDNQGNYGRQFNDVPRGEYWLRVTCNGNGAKEASWGIAGKGSENYGFRITETADVRVIFEHNTGRVYVHVNGVGITYIGKNGTEVVANPPKDEGPKPIDLNNKPTVKPDNDNEPSDDDLEDLRPPVDSDLDSGHAEDTPSDDVNSERPMGPELDDDRPPIDDDDDGWYPIDPEEEVEHSPDWDEGAETPLDPEEEDGHLVRPGVIPDDQDVMASEDGTDTQKKKPKRTTAEGSALTSLTVLPFIGIVVVAYSIWLLIKRKKKKAQAEVKVEKTAEPVPTPSAEATENPEPEAPTDPTPAPDDWSMDSTPDNGPIA